MAHATAIPIRVYRDSRHVGYCSIKRAAARVYSSRAIWRDDHSIEMRAADPRDKAERARAPRTSSSYDQSAVSGLASLGELHNIPVSNARRLLGMGRNTGAYCRMGVA